jgi:ribulose-5-phosphate 4-epimerase/fuculose-1-phosphate aldolase
MAAVSRLKTATDLEWQARVDLAAAFRWFARLGMHESVANHFSYALSEEGGQFLINPRGRHFSRMRASELLLLDVNDEDTLRRPNAPDPTAWYIHGRLHAKLPQARCIMHLHPRNATVIAALADSSIPPIDQNTMRFYGRVAQDEAYGGMALCEEEGDRLAKVIGDKPVLMMGNHGVMVVAPTIAQALDEMYYLERACETLVTCYATGRPLRVASANVAALTAQQWVEYPQLAEDHFAEVKAILDAEEPDFRS